MIMFLFGEIITKILFYLMIDSVLLFRFCWFICASTKRMIVLLVIYSIKG